MMQFREMAITAIGSVCVDPGMVPSSKTQSYLLEFTEAVEFLCNEWKSHYQSEPAKVLPVVYALACMAHKHFPVRMELRSWLLAGFENIYFLEEQRRCKTRSLLPKRYLAFKVLNSRS